MPDRDAPALPPWAASFAPTFARVARQLELAEGFMLLPVELPDAITAALLAQWLTDRGLPCRLVDANGEGTPPPLLEQLLAASDDRSATLLCVDRLSDGLAPALQLLNQQRDLLARRHPRPLLWCGPARFLDLTWRSAPDLWSIAAVPIRLATPVTRGPAPTAAPGPVRREQALVDLLLAMFSADELRRFAHYHHSDELAARLPGPDASAAALTHALVDELARRDLLDATFFARLRHERPRRARDIDAVARLWHAAPQARTAPQAAAPSPDDRAIQAVRRSVLERPHQLLVVVSSSPDHLHRAVHGALAQLPPELTRHTIALPTRHDDEAAWRSRGARSKLATRSASAALTVVLDAEGQPLGELDPMQQAEIRRLVQATRNAAAHGPPFQLIVPLVGSRAAATRLVANVTVALRGPDRFVNILDLDAPAPDGR